MWKWLQQQIDISDELTRFSRSYLVFSLLVLILAIGGIYFHYTAHDNSILTWAILITLVMSVYERYACKARKSAHLTLLSAVIYSLFML